MVRLVPVRMGDLKTFILDYQNDCDNRLRPHYVEYTGSRPITEVKQRLAWSVLGWETAREYRVP